MKSAVVQAVLESLRKDADEHMAEAVKVLNGLPNLDPAKEDEAVRKLVRQEVQSHMLIAVGFIRYQINKSVATAIETLAYQQASQGVTGAATELPLVAARKRFQKQNASLREAAAKMLVEGKSDEFDRVINDAIERAVTGKNVGTGDQGQSGIEQPAQDGSDQVVQA